MLSLGAFAFGSPWVLAAAGLLPVLWWLLRVIPPAPRRQVFPAIRLLFGLEAREDSAARTPWWVLALRLLLVGFIILAAAQPVLDPARPLAATGGPLVLVVDDGWASARDWNERRAYADTVLAQAERAGRPVVLLPTAPAADGAPVQISPMMSAAQARPLVAALVPKPWPADRAAARDALKAVPRDRVASAVWIADGVDDGHGIELARALQSLGGGGEMVTGATGRQLLPPVETAARDRVEVPLRRLAGGAETLAVRGVDGAGRVLARTEAALAAGQSETTVPLRLPPELRNRLARLDIEDEAGAASTVLLDERWRRRPVGLAGGDDGGAPLLSQLTYAERALAPFADIRRGEIAELLGAELAVLVLADTPAVLGTTADRLGAWIEQGGVLVRFAGPLLAQAAGAPGDDPLLPVRLRGGGRNLGGAMSWTTAQGLAPFPAEGPFAGLAVPPDVTVTAQVLAEPTLELSERTWARLADGTPLVTGARRGKGWVVLVHTSSNASWSNLALSGLFVDMLKRLVELSAGVSSARDDAPKVPARMLDGFGRLTPPNPAAAALTGDPAGIRPGPRQPPGLYGDGGTMVALNLSPALGRPMALEAPSGVARTRLDGHAAERDLRAPLLAGALLLLLLDLLVALRLRGLLRAGTAAVALLAVLPGHGRAADAFAMRAAQETRLAYVRTGDATTDGKSAAGLAALSRLVGERSTATLGEPMAVDLETDPVLFFPVLYWPVTPGQSAPSPQAAEKLNAYMRAGGMVVIDTAAQADATGTADEARLRTLTGGLAIPPLAQVTEEHVLTRSFYLLREMPGRYEGGAVWAADARASTNDGVSPVVVGGNDWAGAWAADKTGRPLFATVPGGERQRELAYRFGVNLVMYALTGNYKADQVHVPAIMERLGR
ncbi:MAG: DUF4159 domain-containing protein [Bacteroidales bacterium]